MYESLRLEYACTQAEQSAAQNLLLADNLGGGSKTATLVKSLAFIALLLVATYFRISRDFPGHPILCGVSLVLLFGVVFFFVSRKNNVTPPNIIVEVSADEIKIYSPTGHACLPLGSFDKLLESETLFVLHSKAQKLIHIFPKRVFSEAAALDWFRSTTETGILTRAGAIPPQVLLHLPKSSAPNSIVLQFKLGFRNYIDRSLASWFTRGAMIFMAGLMFTAWLMASLNPRPNAVFSIMEMWIYFFPPILGLTEVAAFVFATAKMWLEHRSAIATQTVTIADAGFMTESSFGRGVVSWEQQLFFKETRWSFIVWRRRPQFWLLLPKSAFPSPEVINACRMILTKNAKRSTWFF